MTELKLSDSIAVAMAPDELYALVSDVTRMGDWSPICRACWWDEGDGPRVGAWFTGRNELPERTWETRCRVVAADPGREFAWEVNDGWVHWEYAFEPEDGFPKFFCSACGAALWSSLPKTGEPVGVRFAAFDGDPGVRPAHRQYVAYAAAWEPIPDDGLPRYPERPPPQGSR